MRELSPESGQIWRAINTPGLRSPSPWIFRGQRDATWTLKPSAFRPSAFEKLYRKRGHSDERVRLGYEHDAVMQFAAVVESQGFEIPFDSPELRDTRTWAPERTIADFPHVRYHALYALAQHHGIPTRLLDWSTSPMVASYFACFETARALHLGESPPERLSVWALDDFRSEEHLRDAKYSYLRRVSAPSKSNPNLRLQKGIFTLVQHTAEPRVAEDLPIPDLDELLGDADVEPPVLYKFTLPSATAPELLRLLDLRGVSASSVFHGHQSATAYLEERTWQRPRSH